ncbi:hypothetical protein PG984_001584 [Apiospora sp. TS-2023a]
MARAPVGPRRLRDALEEGSRPAAAANHRIGQIHAHGLSQVRSTSLQSRWAPGGPVLALTGPASTFLGPEPCLSVDIDERTYHPAIRDNCSKGESGGLPPFSIIFPSFAALDCDAGNLASSLPSSLPPTTKRAGLTRSNVRLALLCRLCFALLYLALGLGACICPLWLPWQLAGSTP